MTRKIGIIGMGNVGAAQHTTSLPWALLTI